VLEAEASRVTAWVGRRGTRPNLALRRSSSRAPPVGRVLARGARMPVPARGAVVVLRWDVQSSSYYVLTSYPETQ
jgi:hypothetical protein